MMRKLKKTDFLFVVALMSVLLLHLYFVFIVPYLDDESFYASIPFRLVNGDSLIQHEWHLSQFSSLFSCLPVYIWTAVKGSADGILIFLRCTYLLIHTTIAVIIYGFFRKYGKWAIMASMIFYIQISYRVIAISYHSMFVVFLLLLSLCLISIYQKNSVRFYILAGICFGCCCVCNPIFCFAFALYLFCCALWTKRQEIEFSIIRIKTSRTLKKEKKLTKKQKRQQKQQLLDAFPNVESYNCFFKKEAILRFSCGIFITVVIAVVFYFSTGGTIGSIIENIGNLLGSSEYDIASHSVFSKFKDTSSYFNRANLGMPWILPAMFIVLLFDKKRRCSTHRFAYLLVSVLWTILFVFGIIMDVEISLHAYSLPFFVISTICYLLTENKNKTLFHCMYIPCLIATFFQYLAADTHLAAIGIVLAVNNVAGVFFAMDLFKEIQSDSKKNSETSANKDFSLLCRRVIIIGFCMQMLLYGAFYQYGQISRKGAIKATTGPYSGLYMTEEQYNEYNKEISDMDAIKALSKKDDPVLLASYNNWMYLYLERPMATYTTWYQGSLDQKQLISYYKENPEKIPKYIYIELLASNSERVKIAGEMFEFTKEELSNGVLLTVEGCKF